MLGNASRVLLGLTAAFVAFLVLDFGPERFSRVADLATRSGAIHTNHSADCPHNTPQRVSGQTWNLQGELLFSSNDVLRMYVCSSGLLTLSSRGSAYNGHGPHMVVSLTARNIWEGEVLEPVSLQIDVPNSGWLTLAFPNDRYEPPQDRNLWIQYL